jgi:hypothetical protein
MPSVVQRKHLSRGRPRKRYPPLAIVVTEFCQLTGWSRSKAFEEMAGGRLRYVQDVAGAPRRIVTSELIRLGFIKTLNELLT